MTPPFVSPPFLEFKWGLRQWAERKRRGPLKLETWLSLVEITLETFWKAATGCLQAGPCEEEPVAVTCQLFYFVCVLGGGCCFVLITMLSGCFTNEHHLKTLIL